MGYNKVFLFLLILYSVYDKCMLQCPIFQIAASTGKLNNRSTAQAPYMTYVGYATNITCAFDCTVTCDKRFLTWNKDGERVYGIFWQNIGLPNGTTTNFTDKVELVSQDDQNNKYELQWINTAWDDPVAGQEVVNWTCTAASSTCPSKSSVASIQYFRYPELFMFADGHQVTNFSEIKDKGQGNANCTVITNPMSNITMFYNKSSQSDASYCIPFSQHEFICSLNVPYVNFADGFGCNVTYNSPETGAYEEVIPNGCCPGGLFPDNNDIMPTSFTGWEIFGMVVGGIASVAILCVIGWGIVVGVGRCKNNYGTGTSS